MIQLVGKKFECLTIISKSFKGFSKREISNVIFGLRAMDLTKDKLAIGYTKNGERNVEDVENNIICRTCNLPEIVPHESISRPISYLDWEKVLDSYIQTNQIEILINGRSTKTTYFADNKDKLEALRQGKKSAQFSTEVSELDLPHEITNNNLTEGSTTKRTVSYYERNIAARQKCLEEHGYTCKACNLKLEDKYGQIAEEFIHVHHKIPLTKIDKEYLVDPINDLVPLCPNCHSMVHQKDPPYKVEELIKIISKQE